MGAVDETLEAWQPFLDFYEEWRLDFAPGDSKRVSRFGDMLHAALIEKAVANASPDAWDQGYVAGHSIAMRRMSDEPTAPDATNPYRAEREATR